MSTDRPKVSVTEKPVLVSPAKSKKLAGLVKKNQFAEASKTDLATAPAYPGALKSPLEQELDKARKLIDARIEQIMHPLPQGKKKRLFAFKYGSLERVKALDLPAAFKLLGMVNPPLNLRLLNDLNYHGLVVDKEATAAIAGNDTL